MTKAIAFTMALTLAAAAHAQSTPPADAAKQQAQLDAQFKSWQTAVTQLLSREDVKSLGLKAVEVEAYTAAIVDNPRPDLAGVVRRMTLLHKDQDATYDIVDTWTGMKQMHQRLGTAAPRDRGALVTALRAKHLSAQASAALARTEESAIGGRSPTDEGRLRAKALADAALALSADSPDAHEVMGEKVEGLRRVGVDGKGKETENETRWVAWAYF